MDNYRYKARLSEDQDIKSFQIGIIIYFILITIFLTLMAIDVLAQNTEDATFHEGPSTEDVETRLESEIINQLDIIERPSMDVEIKPEPALIDFNAPNYLDMVRYRMTIALHDRAIREGKTPDYYVNIFNEAWEREHADNKEKALKAIKEAVPCPNGFEIYPNSGICNSFSDHTTAEQHYYHASLNNYQLSQRNGELEAKCGYGAPTEKACNDIGWSNGNIWKPDSDTRPNQGVVLLQTKYCDGQGGPAISNFRIEDALGGQVANASFDICNKSNGGRLHYRFSPEGGQLSGPVFVRYSYKGVEECRRVSDPATRQD